MKRTLALCLVALTVTGCAARAYGPTTAVLDRGPDDTLTTLIVGDSLSGGYFATEREDGFDQLLLDELEPTETVTATRAHQTLSAVSGITEVPEGVELAIIELGTNDVGMGTPIGEFRAQYDDLLEKVLTASPEATLVCLGTWTLSGQAYDEQIRRSCTTHGGRYVRLSSIARDPASKGPAGTATFLGEADNFHPNDHGHAAIAEAVLAVLVG